MCPVQLDVDRTSVALRTPPPDYRNARSSCCGLSRRIACSGLVVSAGIGPDFENMSPRDTSVAGDWSIRGRAWRLTRPLARFLRSRKSETAPPWDVRANLASGPLPSDLSGRLAVVTGAAQGIGLGIARRMAAAGARVLAVDKNAEALTAAFPGGECIPIFADLSLDADQLADRLVRDHGPIELIVNNVGIETRHRFLDLEPEDFDLVFNTNLRGPWFFTRRLVQALLSVHRNGAIIFISSVHDTFIRLSPHYSASKAAVSMLARELAKELAPHGIRVNVISPGWIFRPKGPEDRPDPSLARWIVPLGQPGKPDDIARMAVVLLSDEWSGYMTGANVRVDGGQTLLTWST